MFKKLFKYYCFIFFFTFLAARAQHFLFRLEYFLKLNKIKLIEKNFFLLFFSLLYCYWIFQIYVLIKNCNNQIITLLLLFYFIYLFYFLFLT